MTKKLLGVIGLAALAALFASCILLDNPVGEEPGWQNPPEPGNPPPSSEFRQTVPFTPGGTVAVENDYGDVTIAGWDREEVEIVARAATVETGPQNSGRPYRIRKVTPEVEVQNTDQGLLIRTPAFEGPGQAPAVDFEIKAPRDVILTGLRLGEGTLAISDVYGRIEASVELGDCSVANFSGSLKINLGTGNADIEVLDLREGDQASVTSRRGDIVLRLEPGAGTSLEANAPHGGVTSDFDLGVRQPAQTVKTAIGKGGASIILMASNGRVRIIKST